MPSITDIRIRKAGELTRQGILDRPRPGIETGPGLLSRLFQFEKAISFSVIIFALLILGALSHSAVSSRIEARDARIRIQELGNEIGMLRDDLQQAQASLLSFDSHEGIGTMPIEPGDVVTVVLPPEL